MNLFPKKDNVEIIEPEFNAVAKIKDNERTKLTQEIELLIGEKFSIPALWKSVDSLIKVHVQSGIDIGIRLLALKANLDHGEFLHELDQRSIPTRSAQNYMRVAHDFYALDADFRAQLGITKLYAMLQAPDDDREMLVEQHSTSFIDKDELLTISAKELKKRIQEHSEKITQDLQVSEDRRDALHKEKVILEKENERLKSKIDKTSPNPAWWDHMFRILSEIAKWEQLIRETPPDLDDPDIAKTSQFALDRLNDAMARCTRYLVPVAHDPAAGRLIDQDRIDDIKKRHSDWDFDKLDQTNDL